MESGLETLDYVAIALYMLITFGIAVWFGRKQKSVDDYFVGGRRMPWFAVGLSILATLFSTLSYLGAPGEMIKHGVGLFIGNLAIPFSASVVLLLWVPFFMRLHVTSAYEYLERRFSYAVRLIGAGLFVMLRLGWMSMVVFAASMALDRVKGDDVELLAGPDIYWWICGVGVFAAIYTSVGGIQAMIWTDVLQCMLLLAGILMVIVFVAVTDHTGPSDWWATAAEHAPQHTSPPLFSFDITERVTIVWVLIGNFFWTICTHGSDQVVLQRYFSTASLGAARRSYLINVVVDLLMAVLAAVGGLALLAYYLRHGDHLPEGWTAAGAADKLFPHFLGHELPAGCAGLVISAFICDAMQTLESGVNSITAVVTNDIVPRLRRGRPRIMTELALARLLTVVITVIVTANAYFVAERSLHQGLTLVDMMPKFFNMFVGPLAALFIIGMFVPRCTTRSALPAVLAGLAVAVIWSWFKEIFGTDYAPTIFLAICVPCLTTIGTAFVLSLLVENGNPHPGRDFTWMAVVKRGRAAESKADSEAGAEVMEFKSALGDFQRDGFVVIRQFLTAGELGELASELDRYINQVVPGLSDAHAFYHDRSRPETLKQMQFMQEDPYFLEYTRHPKWTSLAELLVGEAAACESPEWFNKPPGVDHPTPPHQDNYYFNLTPPNVVTIWLALDHVDDENGCLRYLPGSHQRGFRPHARSRVLGFSQGISDFGPEDLAAEAKIHLAPGDIVAHHGMTIHRAEPNRSPRRNRRAFAMVFKGVSCRRDEAGFARYQESAKQQHQELGLKSAK